MDKRCGDRNAVPAVINLCTAKLHVVTGHAKGRKKTGRAGPGLQYPVVERDDVCLAGLGFSKSSHEHRSTVQPQGGYGGGPVYVLEVEIVRAAGEKRVVLNRQRN